MTSAERLPNVTLAVLFAWQVGVDVGLVAELPPPHPDATISSRTTQPHLTVSISVPEREFSIFWPSPARHRYTPGVRVGRMCSHPRASRFSQLSNITLTCLLSIVYRICV